MQLFAFVCAAVANRQERFFRNFVGCLFLCLRIQLSVVMSKSYFPFAW